MIWNPGILGMDLHLIKFNLYMVEHLDINLKKIIIFILQ